MQSPISIKTASHFSWGDKCDGWWLKKEGNFTVIYEVMPPGSAEIKHYHKEVEQFFYILEGVLIIELDNVIHTLIEQEGIAVVPGKPHRVFNRTDKIVKFLVISSPCLHQDRIDVE